MRFGTHKLYIKYVKMKLFQCSIFYAYIGIRPSEYFPLVISLGF